MRRLNQRCNSSDHFSKETIVDYNSTMVFYVKGVCMSNFKVGDKVKRVTDADEIIKETGTVCHTVSRSFGDYITVEGCEFDWLAEQFDFYCDQWTIHSNTLPLSELSDEQAAELFNHWRCNGRLEIFDGLEWQTWGYIASSGEVYRARQKTERELFIEAAKTTGGGLSPTELELVHAMFNVGFKAPKGGE